MVYFWHKILPVDLVLRKLSEGLKASSRISAAAFGKGTGEDHATWPGAPTCFEFPGVGIEQNPKAWLVTF